MATRRTDRCSEKGKTWMSYSLDKLEARERPENLRLNLTRRVDAGVKGSSKDDGEK